MPRKKTAASALIESKAPRRSGRHALKEDAGIPEIYREMLVEAAASPHPLLKGEDRAPKRRRIEEPPPHGATPEPEILSPGIQEHGAATAQDVELPNRAPQTIYDDFASSDESETGFEDVDLERGLERADDKAADKPLELNLARPSGRAETPPVQRRKPATTAEKRLRLDIHKWHALCLLLHGQRRNRWCDNEEVQATLKPLIPRKLISLLHLDDSKPQHARNHGFNKAIEEISDIWQREWTITAKGIRRAFWAEDPNVVRDVSQKLPCSTNFTDRKVDR